MKTPMQFVVAAMLAFCLSQAQAEKKPNILFILADNLGYGEIGVYGGGATRGAPTPRIDSIARQGLRLKRAISRGSMSGVFGSAPKVALSQRSKFANSSVGERDGCVGPYLKVMADGVWQVNAKCLLAIEQATIHKRRL